MFGAHEPFFDIEPSDRQLKRSVDLFVEYVDQFLYSLAQLPDNDSKADATVTPHFFNEKKDSQVDSKNKFILTLKKMRGELMSQPLSKDVFADTSVDFILAYANYRNTLLRLQGDGRSYYLDSLNSFLNPKKALKQSNTEITVDVIKMLKESERQKDLFNLSFFTLLRGLEINKAPVDKMQEFRNKHNLTRCDFLLGSSPVLSSTLESSAGDSKQVDIPAHSNLSSPLESYVSDSKEVDISPRKKQLYIYLLGCMKPEEAETALSHFQSGNRYGEDTKKPLPDVSYDRSHIMSAMVKGNVLLLDYIFMEKRDYKINKLMPDNHSIDYPLAIAMRLAPCSVLEYFIDVLQDRDKDFIDFNVTSQEHGNSLMTVALNSAIEPEQKLRLLARYHVITESELEEWLNKLVEKEQIQQTRLNNRM